MDFAAEGTKTRPPVATPTIPHATRAMHISPWCELQERGARESSIARSGCPSLAKPYSGSGGMATSVQGWNGSCVRDAGSAPAG
eukprot:scaffold24787_cov62-Isochrysis_galbana.AAC.2